LGGLLYGHADHQRVSPLSTEIATFSDEVSASAARFRERLVNEWMFHVPNIHDTILVQNTMIGSVRIVSDYAQNLLRTNRDV